MKLCLVSVFIIFNRVNSSKNKYQHD